MSMLLAAVLTGHAEGLRIVSLAASITQNLYLIGANEELVGCTRFCLTNPEDKIPVVADAVNVNLEKIVALQPDLVVAGGLTSPKTLEALERMGIQSIRLNQPKDFEEICGQCLKLGEISKPRLSLPRPANNWPLPNATSTLPTNPKSSWKSAATRFSPPSPARL